MTYASPSAGPVALAAQGKMQTPKQTCTKCPHQAKCWATNTNTGKPVSTQNVLINILICRLQLGIQRDKAAANLIQLFRPGMIRLISHVRQQGNTPGIEADQLLADMQSYTIECLSHDYKIGDRGRATPYLFDPHQGFLTKWVKWVVGKNRRFYSHHELFSPTDEADDDGHTSEPEHAQYSAANRLGGTSWDAIMEGGDSMRYDPYHEAEETNEMSKILNGIIEDGVTLNSNEFRVIKYCMTNANESNSTRHIDGLHIQLSRLMRVSRPRITRLYKRAKDKIRKRYVSIMVQEEV
jgi:hypothetical protein